MVDKGNADKHRRSFTAGVKAVEQSKWGASTARERYGSPKQDASRPADATKPQDPTNKHGKGYSNDVSNSGWMRGGDATKRPGFDHGSRGKK